MARKFWVWLHRWIGLSISILLIIVGLTGSVLAFREELDLWLNPDLLRVTIRDAPMLDPLLLREKAEASDRSMRVDSTSLYLEPGRSYEAWLTPLVKLESVKEVVALPGIMIGVFGEEAGYQIYLDPYTGEKIGVRKMYDVSLARKNIISFLHRLHMTLALPVGYSGLGAFILGVTALAWTIDCFVSFYLTFPVTGRGRERRSDKSWWSRWKPAWQIKFSAGTYRMNFDIHRAFGLWTWAMLFVFAWSSVAFNLDEVYTPVMNMLFRVPQHESQAPTLLERATPIESPKLDWQEARARGNELLQEKARNDATKIQREKILIIDRDTGRYTMCATAFAGAKESQSCVEFDADSGEQAPQIPPAAPQSVESLSDTIGWWLEELHMAKVFGLPMKIFVCAMGFVITALSVTGVYIWWKKRAARKRRVASVARSPSSEAVRL